MYKFPKTNSSGRKAKIRMSRADSGDGGDKSEKKN